MTVADVLGAGDRVVDCKYRPHVPGERAAAIAAVRGELVAGWRLLPGLEVGSLAPGARIDRLADGVLVLEAFDVVRNTWIGKAMAALTRQGAIDHAGDAPQRQYVPRSVYEFGEG